MFSLTQLLRRAAQINGRGLATADGKRRATWRELRDQVSRFAGGLQRLGVRAGDRVAILSLNSDRYYLFYFGVAWAGGVFVPVNTRLAPPEIVHWLNDSGARVLFVDHNFAQMIPAIRGDLHALETIVYLDDDALPEAMRDFSAVAQGPAVDDAVRVDDELAGLFYTGGTTGRSKGVMLSHKNLVINAMQSAPIFELTSDERALHAAPMFHAADWVICMAMVSVAGENYFIPGFEPVAVMSSIQEHEITRLVMVPTMINMVVNHPDVGDYDLSSLRHVLYGASPMPEAVIRRAMEVLPQTRFVQAYGQTETSPILTMLRPEHHATKLNSAGQAVPGVELAIMDEHDDQLPVGEVGEVCARGP
ncbi:MAG: AMP-binding protein, partial [Gammaproteobacteria bacterium]